MRNVTPGRDEVAGSDEMHVDGAVLAVAGRQHAVVTRRQLSVAGLGRGAIAHRVKTGWLRRKHHGVYLVGPLETALSAGMAALLTCGFQRSALSHRAAAAAYSLLPWPAVIDVTVRVQVRPRPGLRVHRGPLTGVRLRDGLRVTSPAQTLLDLATVLPGRELARLVNEAQVQRLVTHDELAVICATGAAGAVALREAVGEEPALTRSEAERRLRALIARAGLPMPHMNVPLAGHEVDCYWPEQRLVVEVDGFAFHSTRAAFERDRARDATLQAAGNRVIRVTWRQITGRPEAVAAQLGAALAAAAVEAAAVAPAVEATAVGGAAVRAGSVRAAAAAAPPASAA
jgi:very-short-patch-repair endonuclease